VPMTARQRIAWPPDRRQRGREPACLQHRASANIASFTPILAWRARIIVGGSHLSWGLAACGIETVSQRSVQSNSVYRESFSHLASIAQEVSEGELLRFDKNVMPRRTSATGAGTVFERVRAWLKARQLITHAQLLSALATSISKNKNVVFDYAVVDEAQDISVAHVQFIAALGAGRPSALFFAGDLGQRIFQQPFSWKALGVDIRGRSRTLRVNYRTSHQIRTQADLLLGPVVTDTDGNSEDRSDTVSVFNGPPPTVHSLKSEGEEATLVGSWIAERAKAGVLPHEFGVFVRSATQLDRARAAVKEAGLDFKILDEHVETTNGHVSISTMHLAKGLEFRAVVVMACDDEIIPLQERIETVGDNADLQEVYDTERHLLYVACTRARDYLLVSGVTPVSEFLDDFVLGDQGRALHG
jgi:superfamily I DNA/RNA helicase